VTPIFKNGRRNNVEDYRGVAILSAIPKRFELLVYRTIYFSKAFDQVRHQMLLEEMSVGIESTRCLWLRSYLIGRIQRTKISDAVSKDIRVTSGVPQGRYPGPLCFVWFVNSDRTTSVCCSIPMI
jgi:hypothetical protein